MRSHRCGPLGRGWRIRQDRFAVTRAFSMVGKAR
jgi:hypothetical protein